MARLRLPGPRSAGLAAAAALYALTFAANPLPGWALAPVHLLTMAVLARLSLFAPSARRAALGGWLFGLIACTIGVYWLYISLHTYGFMAAPLAAAGVLILAAYMALYFALAAGLARWLAGPRPGGRGRVAALPAALAWACAWTLAEWLRGTLLTGFPWLNAGYAHLDSPLIGWAPLGGVYTVAFLSAFCGAALAFLWRDAAGHADSGLVDSGLVDSGLVDSDHVDSNRVDSNRINNRIDSNRVEAGHDDAERAGTSRAATRQSIPALVALVLALAGWGLAQLPWWTAHGEPLEVRLVQGAIDQNDKFDPQRLQEGLQRHLALAGTRTHPDAPPPDLIVLPETIMPVFQDRLPASLWQSWRELAAREGSTILMGAPLRDVQRGSYTNSVIPIDADTNLAALIAGQPAQRYDKRHLVPFGEFVPYGFRWFVQAMSIPLGDFDRGPIRQTPFALGGQQVAPNICFEDVFGEEMRPALQPGADGSPGANLLVNFSNLGWFGDSWALRQHLQISRMRSIELARPMLRATNTGATAAIDADGQVLQQLPAMQPGVLGLAIQGTEGLTPYTRAGNLPIVLISLAGLLALAWRRRRRAR